MGKYYYRKSLFSIDSSLIRKINTAVQGLQLNVQKLFFEFPMDQDKETVADFIFACMGQGSMLKYSGFAFT
jgi:hypothetical protein